ncbi:MAG: hypothetical protein HY074_04910 [Deltaproteobacteria bacterium]|nr:hypothetical protein [Deltaproteobacteria bacterium]
MKKAIYFLAAFLTLNLMPAISMANCTDYCDYAMGCHYICPIKWMRCFNGCRQDTFAAIVSSDPPVLSHGADSYDDEEVTYKPTRAELRAKKKEQEQKAREEARERRNTRVLSFTEPKSKTYVAYVASEARDRLSQQIASERANVICAGHGYGPSKSFELEDVESPQSAILVDPAHAEAHILLGVEQGCFLPSDTKRRGCKPRALNATFTTIACDANHAKPVAKPSRLARSHQVDGDSAARKAVGAATDGLSGENPKYGQVGAR